MTKLVGQDEYADAERAISEHGFKRSDFESHAKANTLAPGVAHLTGTITFTHKSNGKVNTYKAGHGSTWPAEFERDLRAGVFGRPNT